MRQVFIISDNILSPLGNTTAENFFKLKNNISAVKQHNNIGIADEPFYASLFDAGMHFIEEENKNNYTKFEQLLIASIQEALQNSDINTADKKTL